MGKLEDLVVDETELNEDLLHNVLSDFIRIGKRDNSIITQSKMEELNSKKKILVVLLALKAMKELDMRENESAGPSQISEISGIKKGTVLPKIRELDKEGLVVNEDGKYRVPNYNLRKTEDYILGD